MTGCMDGAAQFRLQSDFIVHWNKSIRIWGTKEPSDTLTVSTNIMIQHWEFADDNPFELIKQGHTVINRSLYLCSSRGVDVLIARLQ